MDQRDFPAHAGAMVGVVVQVERKEGAAAEAAPLSNLIATGARQCHCGVHRPLRVTHRDAQGLLRFGVGVERAARGCWRERSSLALHCVCTDTEQGHSDAGCTSSPPNPAALLEPTSRQPLLPSLASRSE